MMTSQQHPVQLQPVSGQPPAHVLPTATKSGVTENFAAKTGMALGISQIILGALSVIFNIIYLTMGISSFRLGFICGILAIIAGGLGIGAAKRKSKSLIVAFMVLSILAAAAAGSVIVRMSRLTFRLPGVPSYYSPTKDIRVLSYFFSIVALLVAICGVWASVLGCKVTCSYTQPGQVSQVVYQGGTTAPVVTMYEPTAPPANQATGPAMVTPAATTETKDIYPQL